MHYNTAREDADELVKKLVEEKGVRAQAFQADLTSYDDVRDLLKIKHMPASMIRQALLLL